MYALYLLEKAPPDAAFTIEALSKIDALRALSTHTYKRIYLFRLGRWAMHWQRLSGIGPAGAHAPSGQI